VLLAIAAVIGHGVYHGSLPSDSLAFRWRYWVASARLFAAHPLAGVGWENFGPNYLAFRLPVASEEIKDPHNFLVRFATELGSVGLFLLVAWMLLLWWDLTTRPAAPAETADEPSDASAAGAVPPLRTIGPGAPSLAYKTSFALGTVVAIGAAGVLLNTAASVDWTQASSFVTLEVLRRVGILCLFIVSAAAVALRSMQRQELDDRPAPWLLYAMLVGIGLFLVHNLVDFSLFEPGPMFLFAFLCGAALGIRLPESTARATRRTMVIAAAVAAVAWLVVAGAFGAPVVVAEQAAGEGDDALRAQALEGAAAGYGRALAAVPYNGDYAYRAGRALLLAPDPRPWADRILALLDRATTLDPNRPDYWLSRANAELLRPAPDPRRIREGYDRALAIDPNNVQVRLEYASMLRRLGDDTGALAQLREALRYNALLSPDEPKRLPPERVAEVEKIIATPIGPTSAPATVPASQ
jgi:hypothetical protein